MLSHQSFIFSKQSKLLAAVLLVFISFTSCKKCFRDDGRVNPSTSEIAKNNVIVYLHGLDVTNSTSNLPSKYAEKLQQAMQNKATVLTLVRKNSATASMNQQAIETIEQLKKEIKEKGLGEDNIVIIGVSQGGVLALKIGAMYTSPKLKGIITMHSPVEGVNLTGSPSISQIVTEVNSTTKGIGGALETLEKAIRPFLGAGASIMIANIRKQIRSLAQSFNLADPGIADLDKNAFFITNDIRNFLINTTIPVLLYGGKVKSAFLALGGPLVEDPNLKPLLNNPLLPDYLKIVDNCLGNYLGDPVNDGLITLNSQIAKHIAINDKVEVYTCKGEASHFGGSQEPEDHKKIIETLQKFLQ